MRADECTVCDDDPGPIARSINVVFDVGFCGPVGICAAVACHGAHIDAVAEVDVVAEENCLEGVLSLFS